MNQYITHNDCNWSSQQSPLIHESNFRSFRMSE